jgi:oligosaccharide repeat unit polymerase
MIARSTPPFWLHPFVLFSSIVAISLAIFLLTDDATFQIQFQQPKADWLNALGYYGYVWASVSLGMATGALLSRQKAGQPTLPDPSSFDPYLRSLGFLSLICSLAAFVLWFAIAGSPASLIGAVFSGAQDAVYELRDAFRDNRLQGLTSLTNVAPWWFAYVGYRCYVLRRRLTAFEKGATVVLFVVILIYSLAVSERRQLITILVPAIVMVLVLRPAAHRWWVTWFPLIAICGLIPLFLVGEYFRSWVNFYAMTSGQNFVPWALTRLGGYFSTSINNGVNYINFAEGTGGFQTFEGLFKMPGLANLLQSFADNDLLAKYYEVLPRYGNPEFNNPGGMIVALIDFGLPLGGMVLYILGIIISRVWREARRGKILWILVYAQLYFALLEATRVMYATSSVAVTNLLFLALFTTSQTIIRRHRVRASFPPVYSAQGYTYRVVRSSRRFF